MKRDMQEACVCAHMFVCECVKAYSVGKHVALPRTHVDTWIIKKLDEYEKVVAHSMTRRPVCLILCP